MTNITLPRWDLSNVYPGLEAPELEADIDQLKRLITDMETLVATEVAASGPQTPAPELAAILARLINALNQSYELSGTLRPYFHSFVATDSRNTLARRRLSEFERVSVRLHTLGTQVQAWIGRLAPVLDEVIAADFIANAHAFLLKEMAEQARFLMSESRGSPGGRAGA